MKNILSACLVIASLYSAQSQAQSSAENRVNKLIMIEEHAGFNGAGAGLGLFLNADQRLDLSYSKNSNTFSTYQDETIKAEFQHFVSNSFYYAVGVNYSRMHSPTYSIVKFIGENPYDHGLKSSEIDVYSVHAVIGNEWSFGHFFIGAEWIGLSTPLSWNHRNTYAADAAEWDRRAWDVDTEREASHMNPILPNLYLGFEF